MLPWIVCELDNQKVPALSAAPNTVDMRDMGALGRCPLQQTVHLGIGCVGELYDGAGLFRREAGPFQLLSRWRG